MTRTLLPLHAFFRVAVFACAAACAGPPSASSDASTDAPADLTCADGEYVDGELVEFGGEGASTVFTYAPRCLRVRAGTLVRFAGDFSVHPLSPGTAPDDAPPGHPIPRTSSGRELAVRFDAAGSYPYVCDYHYAAGMRGAVRVVP
jgi:plastocyanin